MELHAFNRIFNVADTHDFPVFDAFCRNFQARRQRAAFASKRMVSYRREGVADSGEDAFLIVLYGAGLSVHESFCMDDFSAVGMDYSLVTKADTQSWGRSAHCLQDSCADPEVPFVLRGAWTWRNNYSVRFKRLQLLHGYFVVSVNHWFSSKFADALDKVVNK